MVGTKCFVQHVGDTTWALARRGDPGAQPATVVNIINGLAYIRPDEGDAMLAVPLSAVMPMPPEMPAQIVQRSKVKPLRRMVEHEAEGTEDNRADSDTADS